MDRILDESTTNSTIKDSQLLVFVSATMLIMVKVIGLVIIGFLMGAVVFDELVSAIPDFPSMIMEPARYQAPVDPLEGQVQKQIPVSNSSLFSLTPKIPASSPLQSLASVFPSGQHVEPAGCVAPPEDHSFIKLREWAISRRTYAMLRNAQELYGGLINITGSSLIDVGSFGRGESGILAISVISPNGGGVYFREVDPLIRSLRVAGFAAWLREGNELYQGSEIQIQAIAIGDPNLSPAAEERLTGKYGYFRGYSGIYDLNPKRDRHGGPILCQWMIEAGYSDMRSLDTQASLNPLSGSWQQTLREVAETYITTRPGETVKLAREMGFQGTGHEDPSNMCGPLSALILRDAGLLPESVGPISDLKNFWLANPQSNGRPWSLFPMELYDLYQFDVSIGEFDYSDWPLYPGDFVFTHAGSGEYSHMFIVTEVDERGRAYTVTNQKQRDGNYLVQNVLLYDPTSPIVGAFKNTWTQDFRVSGRTGLGGFEVLRRKSVALEAGTEFSYVVLPGDTVMRISKIFNSNMATILEQNPSIDPFALQVGETLLVQVNLGTAGQIDFNTSYSP